MWGEVLVFRLAALQCMPVLIPKIGQSLFVLARENYRLCLNGKMDDLFFGLYGVWCF